MKSEKLSIYENVSGKLSVFERITLTILGIALLMYYLVYLQMVYNWVMLPTKILHSFEGIIVGYVLSVITLIFYRKLEYRKKRKRVEMGKFLLERDYEVSLIELEDLKNSNNCKNTIINNKEDKELAHIKYEASNGNDAAVSSFIDFFIGLIVFLVVCFIGYLYFKMI